MADDFITNPAAGGATFSADDLGGAPAVLVTRVKLMLGADGVNGGDVAAGNPMPVADAGGSLTIDGTVAISSVAGTVAVTDNAGSLTVDNAALSVVGGGTEATALRVTLANDGTGVVSIDDNGGSLTVDGTVAVTGTLTVEQATAASLKAQVQIIDGAGDSAMDDANNALRVNIVAGSGSGTEYVTNATAPADPQGPTLVAERDDQLATLAEVEGDWTNVRSTSKGALWVALADSAGDPITSFGGGTEYTVNAVAPADPAGGTIVAERDDQLSTLTEVEGDWTNARASAKGALWVAIPDVNGDPITSFGGGTEVTEDAAAAANPTGGQLMARRRDAPAGETTTDGDVVALNSTDKGELYVKHIDAIPITDNAGSLTVDGTVAISGSVAVTNAALSVTGGGVEATALRVTLANDSTGVVSVDDNGASLTIDNSTLAVVGGGTEAAAMRVTIANDSTGVVSIDDNGGSLTVDGTVAVSGSVTVAQSTAANLKAQVQGEAAHDAAVAGNPLAIGGRANTSEPGTAVADGDASWLWTDKWGRLVVTLDTPGKAAAADAHGPYTENATASGDTSIIAAPGASTSIVVTGFWLSNQGAAKIRVALTEGAAGTKRYNGTLAADGGGVVRDRINWVLPANTALVVNLGVAGDVDVNIDYHVQATP
jgi:hypothetical protein